MSVIPILTLLETQATTENKDDTEELIEADFLEEFKVTQEGHDIFQTGKNKNKTKKPKNSWKQRKNKNYQQDQIKPKAKSRRKFTK